MAGKKQKNYIRIGGYGDLLIPIDMLDRLVSEGYLARTSYENDHDVITELHPIDRIHVHTDKDIEQARVQMALQGKESE